MPPATSSRASSAHADMSGAGRVRSPPITTTTSPLSSPSPSRASTWLTRPRTTCSCSFVSSRTTAMLAVADHHEHIPQQGLHAQRRLEHDDRARFVPQRFEPPHAFALLPRQEALEHESIGRQARHDERRDRRRRPRARPAPRHRHRCRPARAGSRGRRRPAFPRRSRAPHRRRRRGGRAAGRARSRSLPSKYETSGTLTPRPASRRPVRRVSSHATRSTRPSTSRARVDRSPRLPIGVATSQRVPPMRPGWHDVPLDAHGRKVTNRIRRGDDGRGTQGLLRDPLVEEARHQAGFPRRADPRAPDGFEEALEAAAPLPPEVDFLSRASKGIDVAVLFVTRADASSSADSLRCSGRSSRTDGSGSRGRRRRRRSRPT